MRDRYELYVDHAAMCEDCTYTGYGINVNGKTRVQHLSIDRDFVESIIRLFNSLDLDPIHLDDVVEDILP